MTLHPYLCEECSQNSSGFLGNLLLHQKERGKINQIILSSFNTSSANYESRVPKTGINTLTKRYGSWEAEDYFKTTTTTPLFSSSKQCFQIIPGNPGDLTMHRLDSGLRYTLTYHIFHGYVRK